MKAWEKQVKTSRKNLWLVKVNNKKYLCKKEVVTGDFIVKSKDKAVLSAKTVRATKL